MSAPISPIGGAGRDSVGVSSASYSSKNAATGPPLTDRRQEGSRRRRRPVRIPDRGSGRRVEEQGGIRNRACDRPGYIQTAPIFAQEWAERDARARRLQAEDAAACGRDPDR